MTFGPTSLRFVNLNGPSRKPKDSLPFWSLTAGAPYRAHTDLAAYTHAIRVLALDGEDSHLKFGTTLSDRPFRSPRLLDLRLVVGRLDTYDYPAYTGQNDALESFVVNFLAGAPLSISNTKRQILFLTPKLTQDDSDEAAFARVVAEPWPEARDEGAGDFVDQPASGDEIKLPPLRHVDGKICIEIERSQLGMLSNLLAPGRDRVAFVLRPDGMAFTGAVQFPGKKEPIKGRFLLAPPDPTRANGAACSLHLIADDKDSEDWAKVWSELWSSTMPVLVAPDGFGLRARTVGLPPAFHWALTPDKDSKLQVPDIVDVPPQDLRVEWRGARRADLPDGVAVVRLSRVRVGSFKALHAAASRMVEQSWPLAPEGVGDSAMTILAEAEMPHNGAAIVTPPTSWLSITAAEKMTFIFKPNGDGTSIPVDHDERDLADKLRRAYGWNAPRLASRPNEPFLRFDEGDRPIVSGFAPLERGWLQIPFPNLPLLDATKDTSAVAPPPAEPASVLDGFVRYGAVATASTMLAGSETKKKSLVPSSAPWSITIFGASRMIAIFSRKNDGPFALAAIQDPRFTTRGWFWLSNDRPDALEALPRLGAGPSSFFDVPFASRLKEQTDRRILSFAIDSANLTIKASDQAGNQSCVLSAKTCLSFNARSEIWTKGPAGANVGLKALRDGRKVLLGTQPADTQLMKAQSDYRDSLAIRDAASARVIQLQDRALQLQAEGLNAAVALASAQKRCEVLEAQNAALKNDPQANKRRIATTEQALTEAKATRNAADVIRIRLETQIEREAGALDKPRDDLKTAQNACLKMATALSALEALEVSGKTLDPWPAVAWLRHANLPLAAHMPMTRSATSAVRPLESRELAPFVGPSPVSDASSPFVRVEWSGRAFASIDDNLGSFNQVAAAWPTAFASISPSTSLGSGGRPSHADLPAPPRGIGFSVLGVPGAEIDPGIGGATSKPWENQRFALRYDLPALDEAFATANLPKRTDAWSFVSDQLPPPNSKSPSTALIWPELASFWADQERRRQLALTVHSYLTPYLGTAGAKVDAPSLILGAKLTFDVSFSQGPNALPYGEVKLNFKNPDLTSAFNGDQALKGLSGYLSIDYKARALSYSNVPIKPEASQVVLTGFSPSTFDLDSFRVDNLGTGVADPLQPTAAFEAFSRPFRSFLDDTEKWLVTAKQAHSDGTGFGLTFWYKDVPVDATGAYGQPWTHGLPDVAVNHDVWLDPEDGWEWRLFDQKRPNTFSSGRDRLSLCGFALEPLRLLSMRLTSLGARGRFSSLPEKIQILARLTLGDDAQRPENGEGLVVVEFVGKGDGTLQLDTVTAVERPLRWRIAVAPPASLTSGLDRRVIVTASPEFAHGELQFTEVSIELSFHGSIVKLDKASLLLDAASWNVVTVNWKAPDLLLRSSLRIERLVLKTKLNPNGLFEILEYELVRGLYLSPEGFTQPAIKIVAQSQTATADLFETEFEQVEWQESDRAVAVTFASDNLTGHAPFTPLAFGKGSNGAFMLAAVLGAPSEDALHEMPLLTGRLEGDFIGQILTTPITPDIWVRRLHLLIEATADGIWKGECRLTGELQATNAIVWPEIVTTPIPKSGRYAVSREQSGAKRLHSAAWCFEDHRLPLSALGLIYNKWTIVESWSGFAAVSHTLSEDTTSYSWDSVESFTIGPLKSFLVPTSPLGFAPRYRNPVGQGSSGSAMIRPGIGPLDFVLVGDNAGDFVKALKDANVDNPLVIVGGQLGAVVDETGATAFRLPFVLDLSGDKNAVLAPGKLQQDIIPTGTEIAWMDAIVAIDAIPSGLAPLSVRESDILETMRAAANSNAASDTIVAAQLVEQFFTVSSVFKDQGIGHAPWWLAAAVSVTALWNKLKTQKRPKTYSWLVGVERRDRAKQRWYGVGITAAIAPPPRNNAATTSIAGVSALISYGEALIGAKTIKVLETPLKDGGDQSLSARVPYARQLAAALHRKPRFAVLRCFAPDEGTALAYVIVELANSRVGMVPTLLPRKRAVFADNARGYATSPREVFEERMKPVLEGPTTPIRDDEKSGVAALALPATLPRQAFASSKAPRLADELVWIARHQVPIYLPLPIRDLSSPIPGFLETISHRARLPVAEDVHNALGIQKFDLNSPAMQGFLPGSMVTMSLSERPGVMTARRMHVLAPTAIENDIQAFDVLFPRFGRPAEVGPSVTRHIRTPRPGPLPANVGAPVSIRRPQASSIRPSENADFVIGAADTIQGIGGTALADVEGWTATFIASPYTDGVISDVWDGAVRLRCRLDVLSRSTPSVQPAIALGKLLFPLSDDGKTALASASIRISDVVIPCFSIQLQCPKVCTKWTASADHSTSGIYRAYVDVVLSISSNPDLDRRPNADIAAAFSKATSMNAELRLTVHPNYARTKQYLAESKIIPLTKASLGALAQGDTRPPTTLQWILPAVIASRGSLPLTPATLLFSDSSYDATLGNPAHFKRVMLPKGAINSAEIGTRGAVSVTFSADRSRVHCSDTIALMFDAGFDKPAPIFAPKPSAIARLDGDIYLKDGVKPPEYLLQIQLKPRDPAEKPRFLKMGKDTASIAVGSVYNMSLAALLESDGSAARLAAGDVLELMISQPEEDKTTISLWSTDAGAEISVSLNRDREGQQKTFSISLAFQLTDEIVIEPPSALYFTLFRKPQSDGTIGLSAPLFAQSPLPWRIDFRELKSDFRRGLVQRNAVFVWPMARPSIDLRGNKCVSIYVAKMDRNGQTHLPSVEDYKNEFVTPQDLANDNC